MYKILIAMFSVTIIFAIPSNTQAQFWEKLKKHVEKKVEREVENRTNKKADQAVDKVFDSAEKSVEDAVTGKSENKKAESNSKENNQDSKSSKKNNAGEEEVVNSESEGETKIIWSKYDFVPGDQVIFEDGPSTDEENGEFPSRWDLYDGSSEIAEFNGEPVIMFLEGGTIVPYIKKSNEDYLPDVFTVEFDAYFKPGAHYQRYWLLLYDIKNQSGSVKNRLQIYVNGFDFGKSSRSYPGTEDYGWGVNPKGGWRHISVAYTKGKFKAYMDDTRLINIPHLDGNPSGISIEAENKDQMFIKNIRIAKGGVKYYDRVLTDGKIVVNGIRFDIDKATLKPESMGPINKIYKLMKKRPALKFSIEGHTDSDGDENHNLELSKQRAKTVMDKLISMGISPDRLKYTGFGETKPIDSNATPEGKANNRRVEFVKF